MQNINNLCIICNLKPHNKINNSRCRSKLIQLAYIAHSRESKEQLRLEILKFERNDRITEQSPFSSDYNLPHVKEYQQTINRSFSLGGIGLHTADYAYIRLRPAHAGEGRYFVIVPKGVISESNAFNKHNKKLMLSDRNDNISSEHDNLFSKRLRDLSLEHFLSYHEAKSKGYPGSIEEFEEEFLKEERDNFVEKSISTHVVGCDLSDFEVVPRTPEEIYIPATIEFARGESHFTVLERKGYEICSVEHILASLEACGVDNCRIELEGGREIPVIDGSAYGWTTLIIRAGVVKCQKEQAKGVIKVQNSLMVLGKKDCFISVAPSETTLITAGWDAVAAGAPCLGRSWYTWSMNHDFHFHYSVAPAKTFYHSEFELDALYDSGIAQAGPTTCAIVGMGETYQDPGEVSFPDDEAARHKVIDLTGDLSLLSQNGQGGLPLGHFVAWNTDHELQITFCTKLWNQLIKPGEKPLDIVSPKIDIKPQLTHLPDEAVDDDYVDDKFFSQMRMSEGIEEDALQQALKTTEFDQKIESADNPEG